MFIPNIAIIIYHCYNFSQVEEVLKRIGTNTKVSTFSNHHHHYHPHHPHDHDHHPHHPHHHHHHHQVDGVVVINNEGIPIKSTLDSTSTVQVNVRMMMMMMMMMVMMTAHKVILPDIRQH